MIEGVYVLQEWWVGGQQFTQPQVEGRFVLVDGVAIAILHNRIDAAHRHSATLCGRYRLTAQNFAYGYDDATTITYAEDTISGSAALPWLGMREFLVEPMQDATRVYTGNQEFIFTRDGFTYAENGSLLRRWQRART
ncbi:MAG TPA: hypothetical protein VLC91_16265 [Spongiibacteraceae bacterium]|nr:hypothetical protein [Spongiibacteraceae bacterium]